MTALRQGPDGELPGAVPLRFLLLSPGFALLAAVALLVGGSAALASRWTAPFLAAAHLANLGFVTLTGFGALLQILPVALCTSVARPRMAGAVVLALVAAGTPALALGLYLGAAPLLRGGAVLTLAGIAVYIVLAVRALRAAPVPSATSTALILALAALAITAAWGVALAFGLSGLGGVPRPALVTLHLLWGFVGWIGLLVPAVAFRVVPMLQITPPYPPRLERRYATALFAALAAMSAAALAAGGTGGAAYASAGTVAAGALAVFGARTWRLLDKSRRHRDPSAFAWRLALLALAASLTLAVAALWLPSPAGEPYALAAGVAFVAGFASLAISGMLYRIVPFLAWMERQRDAGGLAPGAAAQPPEAACRGQLLLQLTALALLLAALQRPAALALPAAAALAASALWLWLNLLRALRHASRR